MSARSSQQPIATPTIARIYMVQGKLEQAEALYRELLSESHDDPRLLEGLAETLRRRAEAAAPPPGDRVHLERRGGMMLCSWLVTAEGKERGRLVLESPGRLALRLVTFPLQSGRRPQDILLEASEGTLSLKPPEHAIQVAVAVGLLGSEERFVAIAHCNAVTCAG